MDMSFMAKFAVRGPDAGAVLDRLSAGAVNAHDGVITYTQWLGDDGGILADLTVTRLAADDFLVVASDTAHGRALGAAAAGGGGCRGDRRRRHHRPRAAHRAGPGVARHPGRRGARRRLVDRGVPVPRGPPGRPRRRRRARHPDHLPRRARLGALRRRPRAPPRSGTPCSRRGRRTASGRPGCAPCRACGWRRATATTATTSTTPTTCTRSGSGSRWRSTSRAGSPGGRRRCAAKERGTPHHRLVQVLLEDPEPLLFHAEPVLRDGVVVGYVRAASYGWTLGGAVGLAFVGGDEPVTPQWLADGSWEVDVAGTRHAGPGLAAADVRPDERAGDGLTASAAWPAGPPVWDDGPHAPRQPPSPRPRVAADVGFGRGGDRVVCREVVARAPAQRRVVVARVPVPGVPPGHRGRHARTSSSWPAQGVGGIDERRHWHTRCWQSRHAARP